MTPGPVPLPDDAAAWRPLVAEVTERLGPERANMPPASRTPSGPGERWVYYWMKSGTDFYLIINRVDGKQGTRWEVLARRLNRMSGDQRHIRAEWVRSRPTGDAIRNLLLALGFLRVADYVETVGRQS